MKTYIINELDSYNIFGKSLDIKNVFCRNSWLIFNESNEKEVYIFKQDHTLITSLNGNVKLAQWEFIATNESIILSLNNNSYMFHIHIIDNDIIALQLDGTNEYLILINENITKDIIYKDLSYILKLIKEKKRTTRENDLDEIKKEKDYLILLNKCKTINLIILSMQLIISLFLFFILTLLIIYIYKTTNLNKYYIIILTPTLFWIVAKSYISIGNYLNLKLNLKYYLKKKDDYINNRINKLQ